MLIAELMEQVKGGVCMGEDVPFAEDAVFLARVKEFERKYHMPWFEFLQKLDTHSLRANGESERLDFAEWRMLCEVYSDKLREGLESLATMASPPVIEFEFEAHEGPRNRAFALCYTH